MANRNSKPASANSGDAGTPGQQPSDGSDANDTSGTAGRDTDAAGQSGTGGPDSGPSPASGTAGQDGKPIDPAAAAPGPGPKRRGRPPGSGAGPRPANSAGTQTGARIPLGGFRPNDRAKVRTQIDGLHGIFAVMSGIPQMALSPDEANALTVALCDVCDYHKINLTESAGPYGLYIALALAVYKIEFPRIVGFVAFRKMKSANKKPAESAAHPTSPGEMPQTGTVDFSGDINV